MLPLHFILPCLLIFEKFGSWSAGNEVKCGSKMHSCALNEEHSR